MIIVETNISIWLEKINSGFDIILSWFTNTKWNGLEIIILEQFVC